MKKPNEYIRPEIRMFESRPEAVVCQSLPAGSIEDWKEETVEW